MTVSLQGHLRLRAKARADGRTVLAEQSFAVPFHLSKPYWDQDYNVLVTQVANPTAGILAGDRLESSIAVEDGARLCVTTPSMSRVFQMNAGEASLHQHFTVESGGWLEVLPEPLVLHRGAHYRQDTTVDVATGAGLFFVDQFVPGRVGHGEIWAWERMALRLSVRLDGRLILREQVAQSGEQLRQLATTAGMGEGAAMANAVLLGVPGVTGELRRSLGALHRPAEGAWCGVTEFEPGCWVLRVVAADGVILRKMDKAIRRELAQFAPAMGVDLRKL